MEMNKTPTSSVNLNEHTEEQKGLLGKVSGPVGLLIGACVP